MKKFTLLSLGLLLFIFLQGQDFKVKQQRIEELKQIKSRLYFKVDSLNSAIESIDFEIHTISSFLERRMFLDTKGKGKLISSPLQLLLKKQPALISEELIYIPENEKYIIYYFMIGENYYLASYKGVIGYVFLMSTPPEIENDLEYFKDMSIEERVEFLISLPGFQADTAIVTKRISKYEQPIRSGVPYGSANVNDTILVFYKGTINSLCMVADDYFYTNSSSRSIISLEENRIRNLNEEEQARIKKLKQIEQTRNSNKIESQQEKARQLAKQRRIENLKIKKQNLINKYGYENGVSVYNQKIWIGMTKEMLLDSWGYPEDINRTVGSWGVHEQCIYSSTYVYVENGVVTSWQD